MLSVKAIMVEFVIPYLMAICGIPGAIMELEIIDTKVWAAIWTSKGQEYEIPCYPEKKMTRTMQTAVHFLRVDQFREFSGSFSQSSSRLSTTSTAFSILSSESGKVDSPFLGEKVRSNEL
jgi:hypothetical protein